VLVVDAGFDRETARWRVVLALEGARYPVVGLEALRDALGLLKSLDPGMALDLTLIDPSDATVELRTVLVGGELGRLQLDRLERRGLRDLLVPRHSEPLAS
jgi:hypothetical protein